MNKEDQEKVIQALANATFQGLNPEGMIQAAKFYSIKTAEAKFQEIEEATQLKILEEVNQQIKQREDAAKEQQSQGAEDSKSNTEKGLKEQVQAV